MKMRSTAIVGLLSICGLLATPGAQAAVSYSYVAGTTSYTGVAGSVVTVPVYLEQSGSMDFITSNGGVDAAGAAVSLRSSNTASAATLSVSPAGTFMAANSSAVTPYPSADAVEFAYVTPFGAGVDPTNGLIQFATLTVTVGSVPSTFALTSINDDTIPGGGGGFGDGYTTTASEAGNISGFDLDATGQSAYTGADAGPAYTFTVSPTASPEPATLSLLGLGTAAVCRRRRND